MRDAFDGRSAERGVTLIESLVAVAIAGFTLLAVATLCGYHSPAHRVAALALQGALAETRALAAANAGTTASAPTGATLTVVPLASGTTRVSVYASRPITGAPPLQADAAFPPVTLPVAMTIPGQTSAGEPFTILVASSGYASITAGYAYDPLRPRAIATDPGCDEANGVTIEIADTTSSETHAFECRFAQYDATSAAPARAAP